jgi:hypothetical protein
MRDGEIDGAEDIVGWPNHHFATHRKRFAEFDAPALRTLLALRTTAQRVENAVGSWFFDAALTPQKFGILILLYADGKPTSLSDLRRHLVRTQANVTGLVAGSSGTAISNARRARSTAESRSSRFHVAESESSRRGCRPISRATRLR